MYPRLIKLKCQQGCPGLMLAVEIDQTYSFGLTGTCGGPYTTVGEYPARNLTAKQKHRIQHEIALRTARGHMSIDLGEQFLDSLGI